MPIPPVNRPDGDNQRELREFLLGLYYDKFRELPSSEWDEGLRCQLMSPRTRFTSAMQVRNVVERCVRTLPQFDSPHESLLYLGAPEAARIQAKKLPRGSCLAFLCHASTDKPVVREIRDRLRKVGANCWMDEDDLVGGQDWQREIQAAIKRATVVLVCLSKTAVSRAGFVQKEMKFALDRADEQTEGAIYIIPVRLESCEVPDRLKRFHVIDLFEPKGHSQLLKALSTAIGGSSGLA